MDKSEGVKSVKVAIWMSDLASLTIIICGLRKPEVNHGNDKLTASEPI